MKRVTAFLLAFLVGIVTLSGSPDSRAAEPEPDLDTPVLDLEERLDLAEELELSQYLTEDGYLDPEYNDGRSDKELGDLGVAPLIKNQEHEQKAEIEPDPANSITTFAVTRAGGMQFTASELVSYMSTVSSYLEVAGIEAYCAEHGAPRPRAGDYTSSDPVLVTDTMQRKVLYYGWHGPAQWSGLTSYSQGRTVTSLALSYYYSGSGSLSWSIDGNYSTQMGLKGFNDYIKSAATPPDSFLVYKVETDYGAKQDVMYWQYAPKGYLTLTKSSGDTSLTSGNSYYSLAGAEYGVYSDSSLAGNYYVGSLITEEDGTANTLELNPGTYYVQEFVAPPGYAVDREIHEVTVTANHTSTSPNNMAVTDTPMSVTIKLNKVSANEDVTNGNSNYSLAGAEYSVYRDADCTIYVGQIKTDENGQGSLTGLALDEYWIRETKASPGFTRDTTVHKVDATTGTTAVVEKTVTSTEIPLLDPVSVLLKKVDAETGGAAQGTGSLEGAQFKVRYYNVIMDTDPAQAGYQPEREWIFETDVDGFLYYSDDWFVSGDEFYVSSTGRPSLPYGTVTFEEIKAPEGYLINSEIVVAKVDKTLTGEIIYQEPTQPETVLSLDLVKTQSGKSTPIQGVVFQHTRPDGSKAEYTTDANGSISIKGLQWGDHVLKEIKTVDGLALNTNEITFTVAQDNTITITSKAVETDTNGKITVTVGDDGCIDVAAENKPAPFDLHIYKINNRDLALEDAEFTLYSDKSCKTKVTSGRTDADGNLTLEDLIPGKVYYLKETDAPAGYRLPVDDDGNDVVYEIRVESDVAAGTFTFYVNGQAYTGDSGQFHISGTPAERVVDMTIINEIGNRLPETGSSMTLVLMIAGVALMGSVIAFSLISKRKKDNSNNNEE